MNETRKILGDPSLEMSITCVRVPVLRAHTEVVHLTFEHPINISDVREALSHADGVQLIDKPDQNHFPMPNEATGKDDVMVGRLRLDAGNPCALNMMICGDQLLKGAALNAVQIAETLKLNVN